MYITIKKEKFHPNLISESGLLDGLKGNLINSIIDGLSDDFKEKLKEEKCTVHNEQSKGTIIIYIDSNNKPKIKKKSFCCEKFKNSIT